MVSLAKGVKQTYLVSLGLLIFFIYSFWGYKILTPDTAEDAFFWMLIVRGMGLGLLFIPITTLFLSILKGQEIGQGAASTGMMRQLSGSFGIALITTFISNQTTKHAAYLSEHLDASSIFFQERISSYKAAFISKGMTPDAAIQAAYKVLGGSVSKQAAVLSYLDVSLYLGLLFLVCIPFVLFIKTNKGGRTIDPNEAMH